jgi:hypothetical protein
MVPMLYIPVVPVSYIEIWIYICGAPAQEARTAN